MEVILAGDFNARSKLWGDKKTTDRGELLEQWVNRFDMRLMNEGNAPTCIRPQGTSIVDLTWVTAGLIEKVTEWKVLEDETLSDHVCIVYKLVVNIAGPLIRNKHEEEFPRWVWKNMDKERFEEVIQVGLWVNRERKEGPVDEWTEHMKSMVTRACDTVAKRVKVTRKRNKFWWNEQVAESRRIAIERRRKMTRVNKRGSDEEREEATVQYKKARKELRDEIKKAKANAWQELMETIDKDPWGKPYRIVMNRLKRATPAVTETLSKEALEDVLEELFPTIRTRNEETEGMEREDEEGEEEIRQEDLTVTELQVRKALKGKKASVTAPGPDGVTRKAWKVASDDLVNEVKELYNKCLISGEFPRLWKTAKLVLIPKPVTNDGPQKYRPICLLEDVGKGLERIIAERIKNHLEEDRCAKLSDRQFGFRNGRSTIDVMLNMKGYIQEAMDGQEVILGVSLDIRNAFNSIRGELSLRL